jgi:hypothetical protein
MNKSNHTPGPWKHIPRARSGHVDRIADALGHEFIQVGGRGPEWGGGDAEQDANVALVLRAPETLAALKELERLTVWVGGENPVHDAIEAAKARARAAIRAAEGGAE